MLKNADRWKDGIDATLRGYRGKAVSISLRGYREARENSAKRRCAPAVSPARGTGVKHWRIAQVARKNG